MLHRARPGRVWGLIALAVAAAGAARADGPLRVTVRVAAAADQELLARLRGQTSDLPVELDTPEVGPLESTLPLQVAAAAGIAAARRAGVVVWVAHADCAGHGRRDLLVHIRRAGPGVLTRRIAGPPCSAAPAPDLEDPSPVLEAAALAIRTAIVALAPVARTGARRPRAARPEVAATAPPPPQTGPTIRFAAHWLWTDDGLTPSGQNGIGVRLGVGSRRLGLDLAFSSTWPALVTDAFTTLAISRSQGILALSSRWSLAPDLALTGALGGGAALLRYSAAGRAPGVVAAPPGRRVSALASAELRLEYAPASWEGVGVTLGGALDYLPGAGDLGYVRQGRLEGPRSFWRLAPRALLGFQIER